MTTFHNSPYTIDSYAFTDRDTCNKWLNDWLKFTQSYVRDNASLTQAALDADVQESQCGCTDIVSALVSNVIEAKIANKTDKVNICKSLISIATEKIKSTTCATKILRKIPLLSMASRFCGQV